MKIALLGGTFNPIHNGHLRLAEQVLSIFHYDKIIFVPSYIPAHKDVSTIIQPEQRLHMLKVALKRIDWADYSDCEMKRKGVSYTVDTLKFITENYNLSGKPGLIIGDDLASGFSSWRNPQEIVDLADLIVAHRLHSDEIDLSFPHRYINNEIFTLSSSELREQSEKGRDISMYIPEKVYAFIKEKGLYLGENRQRQKLSEV